MSLFDSTVYTIEMTEYDWRETEMMNDMHKCPQSDSLWSTPQPLGHQCAAVFCFVLSVVVVIVRIVCFCFIGM